MDARRLPALLLALVLPTAPTAAQEAERFDLIVRGGRVVDGTGNPWSRADVGVRGDRIFDVPTADNYLLQGGTTLTEGNDGGVSVFGESVAQEAAGEPPVVWVLATGGTISGGGQSSTSLTRYRSGAFSGEQLVAAVPAIAEHATVRVEQVVNIGSPNITFDDWLTLARRIDDIFRGDPDVAGVVITHGTNTLEETAYFLNLTVRHDRPVVLVGAQRPATAISTDGPLNLLNAVRAAASPEARGKGVLVVMNDEINAARDVTKTSTYRVETFRSRDLGFLGYVDGDRVAFYRAPTKRHTADSEFDLAGVTAFPTVDIVYSYVEPNPVLIETLIEAGVDGIVLAGTGAGLVSSVERAALDRVASRPEAARPVVVRSNRTGSGRVVPLPGYDARGMIAGDTLNPQKARILLMLALTKTRDLDEIRRIFREY